eukprot:6784456-Ditylum_brightwellii.AAC.1
MQGNIRLKILRLLNLQQRAKHAKPNTNCAKADKVSYKDINAFVNTKKKEKEVKLNAFDKFCSLNVENSNEEDKPNKHALIDVDNDDSSASRLLSDDSNSNVK